MFYSFEPIFWFCNILYVKKWQLSVNVKKTKAIIFQQRNIPYNKSDFYLNGYKLEKTPEIQIGVKCHLQA
jgi:hypothetical protein